MVFNQEQEVSRVFLLIPDEIFAARLRLHSFHVSAARAGGGGTSEEDVPTAAAVPDVHVHVCVCTDAYSVKHLTSI